MIAKFPTGVEVSRLGYRDGYLYEYRVPNGMTFDTETSHFMLPPFGGKALRSWSEGRYIFYAIWLPNEAIGQQLKARVVQPEVLSRTQIGQPEPVYEAEDFTLDRVPYHTGWVYRLKMPLGRPWPSFYFHPPLAAVRSAPVVGVEVVDSTLTSIFWVDHEAVEPAAAGE